jgi:hypothetical protein
MTIATSAARTPERYPSQALVDQAWEDDVLMGYKLQLERELREVERLMRTRARDGMLCG